MFLRFLSSAFSSRTVLRRDLQGEHEEQKTMLVMEPHSTTKKGTSPWVRVLVGRIKEKNSPCPKLDNDTVVRNVFDNLVAVSVQDVDLFLGQVVLLEVGDLVKQL